MAISKKDPQFIYGLAWVKWKTGDNRSALKDALYLLHRNPSPLIRARTLFLLGSINLDERELEKARMLYQEGLVAYEELNKFGGQFLCLSMLSMIAVHERNYEQVEPLLKRAYAVNERLREKGFEPYSLARYHEIIGEMHFTKGDFQLAQKLFEKSESVYRETGQTDLADEILTKVALLMVINGEPAVGGDLARKLWEAHHQSPDRGRLLAYLNVTLLKLAQCSQNHEDQDQREEAALAWASSAQGGRALKELMETVKKIPCPEWR